MIRLIILCISLNIWASNELCINISGIKPLLKKSSFEESLVAIDDNYISVKNFHVVFPIIAQAILSDTLSDDKNIQNYLSVIAHLQKIRHASSVIEYRGTNSNELSEIIQDIDELFMLLPDSVEDFIMRAPGFDLAGKGTREIICDVILPHIKLIDQKTNDIESVSDLLVMQLSILDSIESFLESRVDNFESITVENASFLDRLVLVACLIDSNLDMFNSSLESIQDNFYSGNTADSLLDSISVAINNIELSLNTIDQNIEDSIEETDTIESKLDAFIVAYDTDSINSVVDSIEYDVCSIDSKVCYIESDFEMLSSRLDAIKLGIGDISSGISIIDSLLNP